MKRIILFRFHKHPLICKNRLKILKKLNPKIPIYGLYGGDKKDFKKYEQILNKYLVNIYQIKGKSSFWKWKNSDFAIGKWYREIGKSVTFDMVYIIEWDLLLLSSINNIYRNIPVNSVGVTGLTELKNIEKKWLWTSKNPYKKERIKLLEFVKINFDYNKLSYASLGPGVCLPKNFLEKYSSIDVPDYCNDELRIPLFAQIFGFKLYDTGFYKSWFDVENEKTFNCMNKNIKTSIIEKELKNSKGVRVFHPYKKIFDKNLILIK